MKKCRGNVVCSWLGEGLQCQVNSDFCPYLEKESKKEDQQRHLALNEYYSYQLMGDNFQMGLPKEYKINLSQVKTIEDIKEVLSDLDLSLLVYRHTEEGRDKIERINNSPLWIEEKSK